MNHRPVSARINPEAGMDVLSKAEVSRLTAATTGNLYDLFRRCTLAVLTTGAVPNRRAQRASGAADGTAQPGEQSASGLGDTYRQLDGRTG
mgnify:CR=1 FL=1